MARFGFCGPTYASQSLLADAQRCINWYPEVVESQVGKSAIVLYPTPGLKLFSALTGASVRGQLGINGRMFAVAGGVLSEVLSNGSSNALGNVANDGLPASMAASPNQLLVASAGHGYVYDLNTAAFTADPASLVNPSAVVYFDSYFVAIQGGTNKFQISTPLDATAWSGLNVTAIQVFPDNLVSLFVDHREMWVFGQTKSTVYYDSGSSSIFDLNPNAAVIEQGLEAAATPARLDNTVYWLGSDERGAAMAYRANGYTPQRVSNHAIEYAWSQYPTRRDAIAYSYQDQGHSFYVISFPSGKATWVFDAATQMWHERPYFNNGAFEAHLGQNHVYAFGKHLVGDRQSGNIYEMSLAYFDDAGNTIRRVRRAPHISAEQQWFFHNQLQVDVEVGLGPQPPFPGPALSPAAFGILQDSNGQRWQVLVTDGGILQTNAVGSGTVTPITLNDTSTNSTSWKVGVTTGGLLTTTSVTFASGNLLFISGVSPSGIPFKLTVTLGGLLQTVQGVSARGPLLMLRWSNDGAKTWSNEYMVDCGQAGNYRTRAIWRRLGRSRDRVYELAATDPIPWRIMDAYLDADPGYKPQERQITEMSKRA